MNREEAVERLKEHISAITLYVTEARLDEEEVENELLNIEALDLAIEALKGGTEGEAESATTTDCISRQQAIEAYDEAIVELVEIQKKELGCIHFSECAFDTTECQLIARKIKSLPPVTPTEQTIKEIMDFIGGMNMVGEISNEAYAKISDFVDDGTPTERTGEWVADDVFVLWTCSECNHDVDKCTDYCPNCGAKMGGDTE